jgi:hypothetical protein
MAVRLVPTCGLTPRYSWVLALSGCAVALYVVQQLRAAAVRHGSHSSSAVSRRVSGACW